MRAGKDGEKIEISVSGSLIASAGNTIPVTIAANKPNPSKGTWDYDMNKLLNNLDKYKEDPFGIKIYNCNTAIKAENTSEVTIDNILEKRCTNGLKLDSNTAIVVSNSTFVHPTNCIISSNNDGLIVTGCNLLEYTGIGIQSEETDGVVEFTNNLFVSPISLALQINGRCQLIGNSVFDTPYAIQIKSEVPLIRKNLFMAEKSLYSEGKKCIEYLGITVVPEFGPNNVEGFDTDNAYINCTPTDDSSSLKDLMLMKDFSGDIYDYRLRQLYPNNTDPWGIIRETIPYIED